MESKEEREILDVIVPPTAEIKTARGDISVRELYVEDLPKLARSFVSLFKDWDKETLEKKGENPVESILEMLDAPDTALALRQVLATVTDKAPEFYEKFKLTDFVKVVKAFLEVNDIDELKQLFFDLLGLLRKQAESNPVEKA